MHYIQKLSITADTIMLPTKTVSVMTEKLIAIDDLMTSAKHGFASDLIADIRKILEGKESERKN